ncbi:hypothetical protein HMPREF1396_00217 [Helicobacter pylori GAM114Ai]|nr:hypothetical protein HMPREF1396_00217 [Helicobacter pylori GAM114Ai]
MRFFDWRFCLAFLAFKGFIIAKNIIFYPLRLLCICGVNKL